MRKKTPRITIKALAFFLACLLSSVAFAQQPPQPCHITITSDFESQCLLPLDKDEIYDEEPDAIIACQENTVTYTATTNTGGIPVVGWSWSVAGASSWSDNGNGSITVTWGNGGTGQITVTITTANDYSCSMTQNVKLIEKPDIYVSTAPAYSETNNGDKIIYVCKGASVEFTDLSTTTNSDIVGYSWEVDNPTITSSTPNFRIDEVLDGCNVTHRVYNNCGCYDEEVYTIKVLDGDILKLGCYGTVCHGAVVTYTAESPSCDHYSWYVEGGTIIEGQDQAKVTVQWDNPQNGYGIIGLDGVLCHQHACPAMLSKKIPIIQDTLTITGQEVACVDDAVIYSVPIFGSTEYQWDIQPSAGAIMYYGNGANQKTVVFQQPGTYKIKVKYECEFLECGEFTSKTLIVNVKPKLAIEGEERICVTNNCDLRTNPNEASLWKVVDLTNNATIYTALNTTTLSYHFPHAGKYRVTAENPNYCRPAVFVITVVAAPPAPTASDFALTNPHVACPHSGILLKANPTNPDYSIVWQPTCSDATPQSVSGNSVTIDYDNTVCDINAFNYDRVLGCLSATPYVHTVEEFQLASHNLPTDITVCPGAELSLSVPNQSGVIYEWQLQSGKQYCASVQGNTFSNAIELLVNEINTPETFTLTLKREYCSDMVDYHTITITVTNDLQAELTINAPNQVCQFTTAQLSGSGCTDSYEWHIEEGNYSGNPINYTFNNHGNILVTMKCNPYYSCPNEEYYVTETRTVHVVAAPPVSSIGYNPNSIPTPTVYITLSPADYDFYWTHTPTNSNVVEAVAGVWDYSCTVVDKHPPYCSKTINANVQPCQNILNVVEEVAYDYCTKTITFKVDNPTDDITWGVVGGESSVVSIWGGYKEYITLRIHKAGHYTIKARVAGEPCQSGSKSFTIDFVPKITLEKGCGQIVINNNSSYLNGSNIVRINYNSSHIDFPVQLSTVTVPVPSGTYTLSLASFNGNPITPACSLGTVSIVNTSNLPVTITLPNLTNPHYQTCDNIAIQLTATIPAPHSIAKTVWNFGDNSSSKHSNPIYHTFGQYFPNHYTVTATITDENKCVSTGTVNVWSHVNNLIPAQLTPEGDKVCEGVLRKLSYTPAAGTLYSWTPGGNTYINYIYVNQTGDYQVDVKNQYYCKARKTENVSFYNRPTALIVTASTIYCEGETIKFYGSPDPNPENYTFDWVITDLTSGTVYPFSDADISFTPPHAGNYSVALTISSSEGCSSTATETITVNPTPHRPSIFFNGNECLDRGAVNLSGTTPTTPQSTINWSNGYTGPNANYFTSGEARAWYYDVNTGCKSEEAKIHIEPQPDFDALLTGCYEKCKDYFRNNPTLPVWGLSLGRESILWKWNLNNNNIDNGTVYYPYYLSLPLQGFGDYTLDLRYHGGICGVLQSPTLTINPKEMCDCKDLDVISKYKWYVKDCNVYYDVKVRVCNNSDNEACLSDLKYLFGNDYIHVLNSTFAPTVLLPGDCYDFYMTIMAMQFKPSSVISFTIYDKCNHCTTDFSINLKPEKIECEMPMKVEAIDIIHELSSDVAGYFKFIANVNPAENVLDFWTEPPMVIDYYYDGVDKVYGINMIDMSLLSQLVAEGSDICFYALTCFKDKLCLRKYCMPAKKLYELFVNAGIVHKSADNKSVENESSDIDEQLIAEPRLMPNPTNGVVNVIGTSDEVVEVLVLDMNGRQVATFNNTTNFNISNLSSGIYIVRVKTIHDNAEKISYLKLIKK